MQALAALCVRRPVFASVLILSLVVVGAVRVHAARRRPAAERRHPHDHGDDTPAGRGTGADRKRDHRQDRGSGQHDQRHRPAQLELRGRHLAGHRHVPARQERRCRGAGSARPGQSHPASAAEDDHAADDREAGSRRTADPHDGADGRTSRSARSPSTPTKCCAAASRAPTALARCWCSGDASGRSTCGSTRERLRGAEPDGQRRRALPFRRRTSTSRADSSSAARQTVTMRHARPGRFAGASSARSSFATWAAIRFA